MTESTAAVQRAKPEELAKSLVAGWRTGTVAVVAEEYPYATTTDYAVRWDDTAQGRMELLFLWSDLASHSKAVRQNNRVSLHVSPFASEVDCLSYPRVILQGQVEQVEKTALRREAFLAQLPAAQRYIDFSDFHFYRFAIKRLRYIGGFGQMGWISGAQFQQAELDPVVVNSVSAIQHMNSDHVDNMRDILRHYSEGELEAVGDDVRMVGLDRYGFDLLFTVAGQPVTHRIPFPETLTSGEQLRPALVAMSKQAKR